MTWMLPIALALAVLAVAATVFRVPVRLWSTLGAALALGLAGFTFQARPGLPAAPAAARPADPQLGWAMIEARLAMIPENRRSRDPKVLTADAFTRHQQYANAVTMLNGAVASNPRDEDAWLAMGNALVEQAEGALSPAALLAYRRAQEAHPGSVGPGYFIGLSLIRQGRMDEASRIWRETLEGSAPDAAGRPQLQTLLSRLDAALAQQAAQPGAGR